MEKFQQVIFKLAENYPNAPLTPAARTLLQDRLSRFVSQYKTPDHPPYSAMIERAIRELNEKRGSSEDSISRFLKKEYDNLPWAHSTILKNHLRNLCESGDIILTHIKRYKLAGETEIPCLCSSNSEVKRRKSLRKKKRWRWDWERSRRKRKGKLIKIRIQEKGKKVEVKEKHQESHNEREQQLAEENGVPVAENGKIYSNGASSQPQKIGPSEITQEQPERQQSESSQLEILIPPGFELALVENSSNSGPAQPKLTSGEEFKESERARRQLMCWSRSYPEPKAVTIICHKLEENHSHSSNRVCVEQMHQENNLKSVENHVEISGDRKYSRKRKRESKQSETRVTDASMKTNQPVDVQSEHHPFEPYSNIDSRPKFSSSNEKEARGLLQQPPPQHKEILQEKKQPRRSLRLRLAKTEEVTKDESIVIALPSQNCREECWETVKPSKQKPVNQQQQATEPIKPTDEDMTMSPDRPFITTRRPGRPPKCICARPNKDPMKSPDNKPEIVAVDGSECEGPSQLPKRRGRGRPAKVNAN